MRVDLHQHFWTEPLLDALAARKCFPFVDRPDGLTVLHSAEERPYVIDVTADSERRRTERLSDVGADLAVVAISSPIGIETLEHEVASELIAAHLDGVFALGDRFAVWGPVALDTPSPSEVDDVLARGCIGVSLPAGALAGPQALEHIYPVLERVQSRGVPLFVHPGGVSAPGHEASLDEPLWWRALTDYVSQMQAAWLTFAAYGRRELPRLAVVFAMLAGGAPMLAERLATRGGPTLDLRDPLTFYDTSSYGERMVETMADWVGYQQLVYGSDQPVVQPTPLGRDRELMTNGAELLSRVGALS
ncbi:MAG: hypothetical protein WAK93_07135 [Solirubrobacteraceae bacterium]